MDKRKVFALYADLPKVAERELWELVNAIDSAATKQDVEIALSVHQGTVYRLALECLVRRTLGS